MWKKYPQQHNANSDQFYTIDTSFTWLSLVVCKENDLCESCWKLLKFELSWCRRWKGNEINVLWFNSVSCKLRIHLTNVGPNKSERVRVNARCRVFATAVRAFSLTSTCDKCTLIAYICSSFVRNFLWHSLMYRLPGKHWQIANKHDQTCSFTFAAKFTLGECTRSLVFGQTHSGFRIFAYTDIRIDKNSTVGMMFSCNNTLLAHTFAVGRALAAALPRSGQPKTSSREIMVNMIKAIIMEDQSLTENWEPRLIIFVPFFS